MIRLRNLKIIIKNKILLEIDDFTFCQGKKYVLTGPNGAGKSTLLKSIMGFNDFVKGEIEVEDDIVYQGQDPYIYQKTPRNNFNLVGIRPEDRMDEISFLALENLLDQKVNSLSGGEGQKLCFLRSLFVAKDILMLDEPFSQMDKDAKIKANKLVDSWLEEDRRRTAIIISHDNLMDYKFDYHLEIKDKELRSI
ncbi:MAG: ABC transporter ATP-binding protein [Anaerococcus sp.]|nr:ABC transporter ATP-binding protein [Anaerococcus sp.]MDD7044564.1 ABC transporter ATP-binding protein [Peptoniphilaceae bacterium]MDY2919076.1 ABC transporter ATP-binding protein [Anaerococcus sp.]